MNVTEIQSVFHPEQKVERTDDDMRREFYYIAAGQITQKLLEIPPISINVSPFSAHLVRQRRWYRLENTNNYYYVPTFYIADEKVHEGGIYPNEVEAIFKKALVQK